MEKNTFAQPEEGELVCINPATLSEGRVTQLMGKTCLEIQN